MPSPSRDELRRLHLVNALFAHATGDDLYLAQQIQGAITFSLAELAQQTADHPGLAAKFDAAFNAAAADLLARLFRHFPRRGFFHWDASLTPASATPLFARAELMVGLRQLSPFRQSTLLVTNLRPACVPTGRRTTPKRQREYEEALSFVRALAAARTVRGSELNLLFL